MIKVGLVDDRSFDLDKLVAILNNHNDIEITFSTTDPEKALTFLKTKKIDLLIPDIEMPQLSGYELADVIHTHGLNVQVIFVTGYSAYAVHAFELDVLDYILKPFTKERLFKGINRFQKRQKRELPTDQLYIKQQSEIQVIHKQDIIFIERTGRSSTIVTTKGDFYTYQSLIELEAELPHQYFIRAHRSFIVHLKYVKNYSLYTKHSYLVHFHQTDQTAMMTKETLENVQKDLM